MTSCAVPGPHSGLTAGEIKMCIVEGISLSLVKWDGGEALESSSEFGPED